MTIADPDLIDQQEAEYAQAATQAMAEGSAGAISESAGSLGVEMLREFNQAMLDRQQTEQRWLQDLRQYRGQYDPEVEVLIGPNRSKIYIRKTRVKVKTVDARIIDLLFPAGKEQNFSIGPTPSPTLADSRKAEIVAALTEAQQRPPTPQEIDKAVREVVEDAAEAMSTLVMDQLAECRYKQAAKSVVHSGNLYGTGILKAPLVERKIRERFVNKNGEWKIVTEIGRAHV